MSTIEGRIIMPPIRKYRRKLKAESTVATVVPATAAAVVDAQPADGNNPPSERPKSKRRFIGPQDVPANAPTWGKAKHRALWLHAWRTEVMKKFAGTAVKIAWCLEWKLSLTKGYAFISDGALSRQTGISIKKIQDGLLDLERGGAIVRASVFVRNEPQRRIWPSAEILGGVSPDLGGSPTPQIGAKHPPDLGGQKTT